MLAKDSFLFTQDLLQKLHTAICKWHKVIPSANSKRIVDVALTVDPLSNVLWLDLSNVLSVHLRWLFSGKKIEQKFDNCLLLINVCFGHGLVFISYDVWIGLLLTKVEP